MKRQLFLGISLISSLFVICSFNAVYASISWIPPTNAFEHVTTSNSTVHAYDYEGNLNVIGKNGITVTGSNASKTIYITSNTVNGTTIHALTCASGFQLHAVNSSGFFFCALNNSTSSNNMGTYNQTLANNLLINSGGFKINFINGTNNPVHVVNGGNVVNITISSPSGASITLDTIQNIGKGGKGFYAGNNTNTNFQFKNLTSLRTDLITITSNGTDVTLDSTFKAPSLACGADHFLQVWANGTGFTCGIDSGGTITTASNIGNSGFGFFKNTSGSTINFRNLTTTRTDLYTITQDSNNVNLDSNFKSNSKTCTNQFLSAFDNVTGIHTCSSVTGFLTSLNGDSTPAQTISSGTGITVSNSGSTHTIKTNFANGTGITITGTGTQTIAITFKVNGYTCPSGSFATSYSNSTGQTTCTSLTGVSTVSDVTASRSFGTVYQNTLGDLMFIVVQTSQTTPLLTDLAQITGYVGNTNPPTTRIDRAFLTGVAASQKDGQIVLMVPDTYYYKITDDDTGSGVSTLRTWIEYTVLGDSGSGITLDTIQNIGSGQASVYAGNNTKTNFQFKTLKQGSNITLKNNTQDVTINSSTWQNNTGTNLGTSGTGVYTSTTSVGVLQFLKLISANTQCAFSGNSTNAILTCNVVSDTNTAQISNVGTVNGLGWFGSRLNATANTIKSITCGTGLTCSANSTNVRVNNTVTDTNTAQVTNVGTANGLGIQVSRTNATNNNLRSITCGTGLTCSNNATNFRINGTSVTDTNTAQGNNATSTNGYGKGIFEGRLNATKLNFRTITVGKGMEISTNATNLRLNYTGLLNSTSKIASYTLSPTDDNIYVNATNGNYTITIPSISVVGTGKEYVIKKTDYSKNFIQISPTGSTIDYFTKMNVTEPMEILDIRNNGTTWFKLNQFIHDINSWELKQTNNWFGSWVNQGTPTTLQTTAKTIYAEPIHISRSIPLTKIEQETTTSGLGGSTCRIGIYSSLAGYPQYLIAGSDAGNLTTTSTGVQTNTFTSTLHLYEGLYFLAEQCSALTQPNGAPSVVGTSASSTQPNLNTLLAEKITGLAGGASISIIGVNIKTSAGNVQTAAYAGGSVPEALLCSSATATMATGWNNLTMTTECTVPTNGTLWLAFEGSSSSDIYYSDSTANGHRTVTNTFGTMPNPFGTSAAVTGIVRAAIQLNIGHLPIIRAIPTTSIDPVLGMINTMGVTNGATGYTATLTNNRTLPATFPTTGTFVTTVQPEILLKPSG